MKNRILCVFLFLFITQLHALNDSLSYYFVYFKDKAGILQTLDKPWEFLSVRCIDRRQKFGLNFDESDLPVNASYIDAIGIHREIHIINRSKWLNGVEIAIEKEYALESVRQLPFVSHIQFMGRIQKRALIKIDTIDSKFRSRSDSLKKLKESYKYKGFSEKDYNKSYQQNGLIGVPYLHNYGFRAQKLLIAVFDAGFYNAYQVNGMEDLLDPQTPVRDFVDYDGSVWEDDSHGAKVLGFMKTFNPGNYIGSAPFADYVLCRTEIATQEYPIEELNWLFAAEFADSIGVDLIAASVGYHAFDNANLNHPYKELNGKSSIIAKAANYAYAKGIAVICSAGNEGENLWTKISTPADATGTMAIGACDSRGFRAAFSSIGPTADGRIKPDFCVPGYRVIVASPNGFYAGNGTSYSSPIFAGAFACLMGSQKYASPDSLRHFVQKSASHYALPDSFYGYGIPDVGLAYCLISERGESDSSEEIWVKTPSSFFQDLNIYFKSPHKQKIKISIKVDKGKKMKKVKSETYSVEANKWLCSDLAFKYYFKNIATGKSKKPVSKILIIIETENGTYQRQFNLN